MKAIKIIPGVILSCLLLWTCSAGGWKKADLSSGPHAKMKEVNWTDVKWTNGFWAEKTSFELTLIPYYTWANRGPSFMTVWIPLSR